MIPVMIIPMIASSTVIPTSFMLAATKSLPPAAAARFLLYPSKENRLKSVEPPITTFAFCNPINAINRPIPTDTAFFRLYGIASKIASRTLSSDNRIKIIPSTSTAASATFQEYPIWSTTVYAKYAFSPIPGASANG